MNEGPNEQPFAVGSVVAGKLRIVRRLGMGGMGAVYEVEHEITRHRRALKLLHAQMASVSGVVERFLREASAAGRIGNPHIVETFDAGLLESGEPYIVMEMLQGKSLAQLLNENGPLEVVKACDIFVQICDGVSAAHAAGIIHRDLKPENLFLCGPGCSFAKILDFGISKFDTAITGVEGFTIEGTPIGTPFYMSPEQVMGQKTVDVRTDVYALGVVLYECLTAHRPFEADNLPQLSYLISQGKYVSASELRPSLPKILDTIIAKAMSLDRSQRFSSAHELGQAVVALRQSLAPPPVEASMPSGGVRSSVPASLAESLRVAPALTPDMFSQAMPRPPSDVEVPSSKPRPWIPLSIACGVLLAIGVGAAIGFKALGSGGLLAPPPKPTTALPNATVPQSDKANVSVTKASVLAGVSSSATPPPAAAEPSVQVGVRPATTSNSAPSGSQLSRLSGNDTRASTNASPVSKTIQSPTPKSVGSAHEPNRALRHGLSVENPFK